MELGWVQESQEMGGPTAENGEDLGLVGCEVTKARKQQGVGKTWRRGGGRAEGRLG